MSKVSYTKLENFILVSSNKQKSYSFDFLQTRLLYQFTFTFKKACAVMGKKLLRRSKDDLSLYLC